ncbi:MAG: flagellar basal body-associated FliL family protein [Treponema sp.]|nr:flagellar basal body-associated FliL family protein [Treponema sp.]
MLNRILTVTAAILVIGICCGTVIGFATHRAAPGRALRRAEPLPSAASVAGAPGADTLAVYAGIARIRAVTKPDPQRPDDGGTTVVITPWFTYPADDTAFYEELAQKSGVIRATVVTYFADHTARELRTAGEVAVKDALLAALNEQFVLGKLTALYFTDYIFFE